MLFLGLNTFPLLALQEILVYTLANRVYRALRSISLFLGKALSLSCFLVRPAKKTRSLRLGSKLKTQLSHFSVER